MAYSKPSGYKTYIGNGARKYVPNNGFISGNMNYAPGAPTSQVLTLTFSAAPADSSGLNIPDGPTNAPGTPTKSFVFTYAGSPGTGIIPLVAGGGTAAQAATAAQVALAAQLTNWTVTNPSAGVLVLTDKRRGLNPSPDVALVGSTNITIAAVAAAPTAVLPGRVGMSGATLQG